ncbi:MAG: hypothetical protein V2I48_09205 [Xanthomonadales bacterium]|jgi:poly(3-hydroxybutyrate) depolymerase|nr:hypothetical protein [Xanthomonadales bacterium]
MNCSKSTGLIAAFLLVGLPATGWTADSPGCANHPPLESGTYQMQFEGLERTYRVHVPDSPDQMGAGPLVVIFHGWGGDENDYLDLEEVRQEADKRGYVLVAARGIGSGTPDSGRNSWSFRGSTSGIDGNGAKICDDEFTPDYTYPSCREAGIAQNSCSWTHCQGPSEGDVEFTLAMVREIENGLCVDTGRIYATGTSNGGMFTWELGQNPKSASTFRAIAPNIGLPHRGYLAGPPAGAGMPALLVTGTRDATVPPGEWEEPGFTTTSDGDRFFYASATAITRVWANALGCSTETDAVPFDAGLGHVDCRSYCSSEMAFPAVLDCRADMGHDSGLAWSWRLTLDFFDAHAVEQ